MEIDQNQLVSKDFRELDTGLITCEQNESNRNEIDISHAELMKITSETLNDVLKQDTILCDLPSDVTLEEVNSQIAVLHGQSITIYVMREDDVEIPVVVQQKGARVIDLKKSVQRHMNMYLKRKSLNNKISWRYIWRTHHLCFDNIRLKDDKTLLSDLGLRNKSAVRFIKRLREKGIVSDGYAQE